jgi:hypothetical protein
LARLVTALDGAAASLVSLQKETRAADAEPLGSGGRVAHFGTDIHDFADTAALILQMDLVVSVDTSIAHLAGALGKPVWILIPFAPDYRWMMGRTDSPWYPTARLFRQHRHAEWDPVLDSVSHALRTLAASFPAAQ